MKRIFLVIMLVVFFASPVLANCVHNGRSYPTGTRLGPLVCTPSGAWKPAK